jgi:hypothetical protein
MNHFNLFLSIGFLLRWLGGKEVVRVHTERNLKINREGGIDGTFDNYTFDLWGGVAKLVTPTGYFIEKYRDIHQTRSPQVCPVPLGYFRQGQPT